MHVILKGKTAVSLPPKYTRSGKQFASWFWTQTENHWSNETEHKNYVKYILAPYFRKMIEELKLPSNQKAVYLMDCWPVQISANFRAWMEKEFQWILVVYIPPSTTSKLQPQDKFYQKPFKHAMMAAFCKFQADEYKKAKKTSMS